MQLPAVILDRWHVAIPQRAFRRDRRYDHIAFGTQAAGRVEPCSFAEYTYGVAEAEHPSDHCPNSIAISRAAVLGRAAADGR
jgi:hypothetical protein